MAVSSNWAALIASKKVVTTHHGKRKRDEQVESETIAQFLTPSPLVSSSLTASHISITSTSSTPAMTSVVAMDCEMVGIGPSGISNALARCSIVNYHGQILYDKYVKPTEPVTDYRTHVSGIRESDLTSSRAIDFKTCQVEVAQLLKDKTIVGHALSNDLNVLLLSHPRHLIRDTSHYKGLCPHRPKALRVLVKEHLNIDIQTGEHSSVEDARSVLAIYKQVRKDWEKSINSKFKPHSHASASNGTSSHKLSQPQLVRNIKQERRKEERARKKLRKQER